MLLKPRTRSRVFEYTYPTFHENRELNVIGWSVTANCRFTDDRSERCSKTFPKLGLMRASVTATEPVVATG